MRPEIRKKILVSLTLVCSPILLLLLHFRNTRKSENPRILVIPQLTRIGDLISVTPIFREIKRKFPHAYVAVLVSKKNMGVVIENPHIDEIIHYQSIRLFAVLRAIYQGHFDISINAGATSEGTAISLWGQIPERIKLTYSGRPLFEVLTDWMNTHSMRYTHQTYLPSFFLQLLHPLGIKAENTDPEVFVTHRGRKVRDNFLVEKGIQGGKYIGISITAGNKIKEWGDDRFKELIKKILNRFPYYIFLIGGAGDRERIMSFRERFSREEAERIVPVCGIPLEILSAFFEKLSLFIAVDTGLIHMAHALDVPLIDILGPVDSEELSPKSRKSRLLLPLNTRPSVFAFKRPGSAEDARRALSSISVDQVESACEDLLSEN